MCALIDINMNFPLELWFTQNPNIFQNVPMKFKTLHKFKECI